MNKKRRQMAFVCFAIAVAIGVMTFKENIMKSPYSMEEVHIRSENKAADGLAFTIREGDIILDKTLRFKVLPAAMDLTKPISRKKASNAPAEQSERLLRIKELGENSAVVAILKQESYFEDSDTIVTKENETLITVNYGEEFSVHAKQQWTDLSGATTYHFIIKDTSTPQRQNAQNFCAECGVKLTKDDMFCRECGTPVGQ